MNDINNGDYEGIEISRFIIDVHYYSLIHIYNAVDIAARDSVVSIYDIHTNNVPDTRELVVALNPQATWVEAWRQGQRVTGNENIDSLMVKYDLRMVEFIPPQLLDFEVALLRSNRALNIEALEKLFEEVGGILFAEPNAVAISFTNDLTVQLFWDYFLIDYRLWTSDFEERHWLFKVYKNGNVEFVGSIGSPAPTIPM